MKTINIVVAAMALSTLSFGVFAAEPVTASRAQNMNKIGVVSADGASTLDALEAKLAGESRGGRCQWIQHYFRHQQQ